MSSTAEIQLNVVDGTRQPIASDINLLVTVQDGNPDRKEANIKRTFNSPLLPFEVPFYNNYWDNYTVIVSASGFWQAGFKPVKIDKGILQKIDIMLIPSKSSFNFDEASWDNLRSHHPKVFNLLSSDSSGNPDGGAKNRYEQLKKDGLPLAGFLNLTTALEAAHLLQGNPLQYFKSIAWEDKGIAQDRFFGWADPELVKQVASAAAQGTFKKQTSIDLLEHPGSTQSYKQKEFGEANLQITFHEQNRKAVGDTNWVLVEIDMDYYQDLLAHIFLEVLPNKINGLTDPRWVYVLRWIAGNHAGKPDFAPPYTIEQEAV